MPTKRLFLSILCAKLVFVFKQAFLWKTEYINPDILTNSVLHLSQV